LIGAPSGLADLPDPVMGGRQCLQTDNCLFDLDSKIRRVTDLVLAAPEEAIE
jgi:hypothetical protein